MIEPLRSGDSALVLGLGLYGRAVTEALVDRGVMVTVIEDRPSETSAETAMGLGAGFLAAPDAALIRSAMGASHVFLPSPGVPEAHPAFGIAAELETPIASEFDLARWWDDRPIAAITGTDGKTTVTMLTVAMLQAAGVNAVAVGNTETPLITAIDDPAVDVFVVEASSFRLGHTQAFAPRVAAWLNWGPDHLDVHVDLDTYARAKASIWDHLPDDGVAIATLADPVVMAYAPKDRRVVTVGDGGVARRDDSELRVGDAVVAPVDALPRTFDHDITNTLTAAAIALEFGASTDDIETAIRTHEQLPHRIQYVATVDGIDWYNDSKATVPHAVVTALRSFDRAVLIAGGKNKGLDLGEIREADEHIASVVAIGDAGPAIVEVFEGQFPIVSADSMDAAVAAARRLAEPGEVVLLSPGCASYDWYSSYGARGDDFIRAVRDLDGPAASEPGDE
jgi:UDP-N-acetylmuramoylalanine--D-glutamate ligase